MENTIANIFKKNFEQYTLFGIASGLAEKTQLMTYFNLCKGDNNHRVLYRPLPMNFPVKPYEIWYLLLLNIREIIIWRRVSSYFVAILYSNSILQKNIVKSFLDRAAL